MTFRKKTDGSLDSSADERELSKWMRKSQAGDSEAYRVLLTRIEGMLQAYVRNFLYSAGSDAGRHRDDLVQEILLAIHSKRHTYDSSQFFLPWMYAIARYKVIDHLRSSHNRFSQVELQPEHGLPSESLSEDGMMPVAAAMDLSSLLMGLPEKQRQVLQLVKLEGFSVTEVSRKLGISESDVKVSVHRAIQKLRVRLEGKDN